MTTDRHVMDVRGIAVEIVRKDIRNLHVGVYPPKGRVRVAAPLRLNNDSVRLAIITRLGWIRRQRESFQRQDRQSQREIVTGESHHFRGRRYRLDVIEHEGPPHVSVRGNKTIVLRVRPGTDRGTRDAALQRWYRRHLRDQLPALVTKWGPKVGIEVSEVRIKRMKTLWGTCNRQAKRIWVNLELAKKPVRCLEYILVHEMVHLLERHHTERFRDLMDGLLPQWRYRREELNHAPLAHEEWRY